MSTEREVRDLKGLIGDKNVFDDPEILAAYAADDSFVKPRQPRMVVKARTKEEVVKVVQYANEHKIAVTPRSSRVSFYGAGIPAQGGMIIDLTEMNRILEIDDRARLVKVEPGVTTEQVQDELARHGLMMQLPLCSHPKKSVLTSAMEREPMLIPKDEHYETMVNVEIVLSSGEIFYTGTAGYKGFKMGAAQEFFIPSTRLFVGAQGTFGIITESNLKVVHTPAMDKLLFIPFNKLEDVASPIRKIQWRMMGNECLVLDALNFATIIADDDKDIAALRDELPPWTLIFCSSAPARFPEEKIAYEEEALREIGKEYDFDVRETLAGAPGLRRKLLPILRKPWSKSTYWKYRYSGACTDLFFMAPIERIAEFTAAVDSIAADHAFPTGDIGRYFQPVYRGNAIYCHYSFNWCGGNGKDRERMKSLFLDASEKLISQGAFFSSLYGPWADMMYRRTGKYAEVLKVVKDVFDPNHIMNPGKLCF
ncbi:MAG TPA: FAD-binding oxidoreductase [Thermodesulfobacteriota bacterium]|nr:FAD-binding oxidoreductase [Thermodesulfobacteriota bacterium]HNU71663.1 FAD-binding oxidoreductase [Thermodesulfobacteriota bacterium]